MGSAEAKSLSIAPQQYATASRIATLEPEAVAL